MADNDSWMSNSDYTYDNMSVFPPDVPTLGENHSLDLMTTTGTGLQGDVDAYLQVFYSFKKGLLRLDQPWFASLLALYIVLFVFSLAGNTVALLVILAENRLARSTNTFLLNMTIADLLGKLITGNCL